MTSENHQILEITKNYLKDIAEGKTADELAIYYSESVKQIEYPNRLFPEGATRNLNDLKEAFLRGCLKSRTDCKKALSVYAVNR
ncbi:hypothetical protein [Calothrix parietina]|uniref:Uncharacterized protein n=1 Tax=Calothrix parietina FACHB-288 TaxID=2692896 RepID=A0ABR8AHU6_9CYAN|nr:hypothetical protein [Calothrix parietina]MBD2199518.1 hypothetical protein [Calothrix parietina FACHB-288]